MYVFVEKYKKLSLNYCQYPVLSGALKKMVMMIPDFNFSANRAMLKNYFFLL